MPPSPGRPVTYEARIGPLEAGAYEVWVGRYDAARNLVEVPPRPVLIQIPEAASEDGSGTAGQQSGEL
jgi:hypothetical protein